MAEVRVVKRGGERPTELFVPEKLHASIQAACLSVRSLEGEADLIAHHICQAVADWCEEKSEVTSNDLRRVAAGLLERMHPEAAYLYKHHELVL